MHCLTIHWEITSSAMISDFIWFYTSLQTFPSHMLHRKPLLVHTSIQCISQSHYNEWYMQKMQSAVKYHESSYRTLCKIDMLVLLKSINNVQNF